MKYDVPDEKPVSSLGVRKWKNVNKHHLSPKNQELNSVPTSLYQIRYYEFKRNYVLNYRY